jgi:hypothetical protein
MALGPEHTHTILEGKTPLQDHDKVELGKLLGRHVVGLHCEQAVLTIVNTELRAGLIGKSLAVIVPGPFRRAHERFRPTGLLASGHGLGDRFDMIGAELTVHTSLIAIFEPVYFPHCEKLLAREYEDKQGLFTLKNGQELCYLGHFIPSFFRKPHSKAWLRLFRPKFDILSIYYTCPIGRLKLHNISNN